jgi:hypothetical protein
MRPMKYFVGIVASSPEPDGVPIEIGWVDENGRGEAHLIRPATGWDTWSVASESVHGISRGCIAQKGRDAVWMAQRAVEVLAGNEVYSDAPGIDGPRLRELLAVLPEPPAICVPMRDVNLLFREEILTLLRRDPVPEDERVAEHRAFAVEAIGRRILTLAQTEEAARLRTHHRAAPNAESIWRTWLELQRMVAEVRL